MKVQILAICCYLLFLPGRVMPQAVMPDPDSLHLVQEMIVKQQMQTRMDSMIKSELEQQLLAARNNSTEKSVLEEKLKVLMVRDSLNTIARRSKIELLKKSARPYPVILFDDTLLYIYTKIGSFDARSRAEIISKRIRDLYGNIGFKEDSLRILANESSYDIVYNQDNTVMSVTEVDALWLNESGKDLSIKYLSSIKQAILKYRDQNSVSNILKRLGTIALIVVCLGMVILLINFLFRRTKRYLKDNQRRLFNGLTIRGFQLFSPQRHRLFAFRINNLLRVLVILLVIYLSLPLMFSVFPETKVYTDTLLDWIISPAKKVLSSVIGFLPNLITIIVIYYMTKWAIGGIRLFFEEIEKANITISGFHRDWAMPTFNILKFVLYAFMLVVIFPYLPGSGSPAFQGVSVFLGILLSLGSSSAITNVIAGLVITYMRPFRIGDRVKIGEVMGDVIEKTMLVTRIRTIKNEDITVPNSTVLSSHTINYSSNTADQGLIVHTTVTIGYDVPWKKMHQALANAASRTDLILAEPAPFVLQTSLDDFYVSYQLNAYTREANKQALIYSDLHRHIQDCCNEAGIEIMSPHYRATRDGNMSTIPENYLDKDYQAPSFRVNINGNEQEAKS